MCITPAILRLTLRALILNVVNSEPARKSLNFEFRPCEAASEAKFKQTPQQIFTLERTEFFMNVPESSLFQAFR